MNPMRWMFLVALALAGCKKEKTDTAPTPAPAPTETAGDPAPSPAPDPAAGTTPTEAVEAAPAEGTGRTATEAAGEKPRKPIVAIGSDGKTKVLPMSAKVVADTAEYTIKLSAPAKTSSGADASATLEVIPKAGWKLNKDFPTKLTVTAPADVKLEKGEQTVPDAVTFGDKAGKWAFDFKASAAGDKSFACKMKFAVCTDTTCDPKKEDLAWNVSVE